MSFNGSGVFVVNSAGQPVVSNTLITAAAFNAFTADVATGLSTCITKDGQTTVTANIPFSGFKLTGIGAATARTDAASLASIQDGTGVYVATVGGTADAITLTPSPAITAYAAGQEFWFIASGANTTATTVTISGIGGGAKAVTKNGTTALVAGDIASGALTGIRYDGTRFQLVGPGLASFALTGAVTSSGLTMNTARLLGRTTASAGAIEEMTVGASLTLSAGSLSGTAASTSQEGVAELLTQAEYDAATDTTRVPTANLTRIVIAAEQATTSGTAIDFTGIPAGTRRITVMLAGVSTNGTSNLLVQIGDSGGIETTGYVSVATTRAADATSTAGFLVTGGTAATDTADGVVILCLEDVANFTWISHGVISDVGSTSVMSGGQKSTSAELDRVRLTTVNGTDAFDAGAVSISYER